MFRIPLGPFVTDANDWALRRAASVRLRVTIAK